MARILFGAVGALIATASILVAEPVAQSCEYWTDPVSGERIRILESRPIPIPPRTMWEDRCMLIGLAAPPAVSGATPAKCYPVPQLDSLPLLRPARQ
jgi:hypothetical protein